MWEAFLYPLLGDIPFGDHPTVLLYNFLSISHRAYCLSIPNHVCACTESTDHVVTPMIMCDLSLSIVSSAGLSPLECSHSELLSLKAIEDFLNTECLTWGWEFHYPLGNLKVCHCSAEHLFLQIEVLITHKEILGITRHTPLGSSINHTSFHERNV